MTTRAGINPNFVWSCFSGEERRIIRCFSLLFYVTRSVDEIHVGNATYRAFLVRPTEDLAVALNVEREIVVVLTSYENFEIRTLKSFDEVHKNFPSDRIDRSVRFIVSQDLRIQDSIRLLIEREPESPIYIPFSVTDFESDVEKLFFRRIRENYLVRDLFAYQSPLRQEYFYFGRNQLVESVIDRQRSGQNSGLFGLRKSGKTSTIYAIQRKAKASSCKTLVIDCQDVAVHAKTFGPLLSLIIINLRLELNLRKIDCDLGQAPDVIAETFKRLLAQTLMDGGSDALIIFDEIENISPRTAASPHWKSGTDSLYFWQILRSYAQAERRYRLTFCFVGTNPHLFEAPKINDVDNPIYLFAPKTFIPNLSLGETKSLLQRLGFFMGLDFDNQVVAYIHSRFGGHPFFTRQIASQVHKRVAARRPITVSIHACKEAERDSISDFQKYLTQILENLRSFYPEEFEMLQMLARGEALTFQEMAQYHSSYVEHLMGYGIVVRRGDDYDFAFGAVMEAVKSQLSSEQNDQLAQRWAELSDRRNALESEIRTSLYRWSVPLSTEQWTSEFTNALTKRRLSDIGMLTRREAFSRNSSPLMLSELMQFVKKAGIFGTDPDMISRISDAISVVNKNRADAHAKDISTVDLKATRQSLDLLEAIFLPPE